MVFGLSITLMPVPPQSMIVVGRTQYCILGQNLSIDTPCPKGGWQSDVPYWKCLIGTHENGWRLPIDCGKFSIYDARRRIKG